MLPKTAEYALRAVVWLGRDPDRVESADRLAERTKVPRRYLNRVLQDLAQRGAGAVAVGARRGLPMAKSPEEVTILDVVNAVGELERIRHCPLGLPSHTAALPAASRAGQGVRRDRAGAVGG